jgi:hypothetical protein
MKDLCQFLKERTWMFVLIQSFLLERVFTFLSHMMKAFFMLMMDVNLVGALKQNSPCTSKARVGQFMSANLCETFGRLKLTEEQCAVVDDDFPTEARVTINPGKNYDGFWNIEQLVKQV